MQKHRPLSFLCTNTTVLHHGLWLGWIAPTFGISFMYEWTSSTMGGGIFQNLSLKGLLSTALIWCFARSAQPNSPGSKEKMSRYSANRTWAAAWFLSDHPCRLDKSSYWKSTSLLHSTDILVHWILHISSSFSKVPGATSTLDTTFTVTTWMTLIPLVIVIGVAVRSSPWWQLTCFQ